MAGNGTQGFSGDGGPATSAEFYFPAGLAIDNSGNLFIADSGNERIRMVSRGVITTVAGNGTPGFAADGGSATSAQLEYPTSVAVDAKGDLYVSGPDDGLVREISNATITTVGRWRTFLRRWRPGDRRRFA